MNMIKLIALDLDGTLLTSDKTISDKTRETLIELQKQGIKLILASGRPTPGLYSEAKKLKMDEYSGYLLSYNGAALHVYDSMEVLHSQTLTKDQAHRIIDHGRKYPEMTMMTYNAYTLLCENVTAYRVLPEAKMCRIGVEQFPNLHYAITFEPHKFLFAIEPEKMSQIEAEFKKPFEDELSMVLSTPYYMEVMNKGISKGKTLRRLLDILHLKSEDLMAFGDGQNDLEMLKMAGTSVCMGNGDPLCKEIADYVTLTNDEDGIPFAIEHFKNIGVL